MAVNGYEDLINYKGQIKGLCLSTENCVEILKNIYDEPIFNNFEALKNLIARINQDNFKVVVIGKFSTGKSSLINALLGEEVLPDSLDPCTAFINEIVYGEKTQATIYFKDAIPENWEIFVQDAGIKAHIEKYGKNNIPPYVLENLDDLSDCITIPLDEDGVAIEFNETDCSPFEKAVIQYPCELCKNGVEIIDSPGLDESQDRTEIVEKYFKKVDAVIYVMTNIATGGDGDKEIVEKYLTNNDIKNIFFVCNLFGVRIEKAKKQLLARLGKIFGEKTLLGEDGIHLVNLFDFANTGVEAFKESLGTYLNNEKGSAQLTSYNEKLTELSNTVKDGIKNFERISTRELRALDADILSLENDIARKEDVLAKSKLNIYNIQFDTQAFCKVDILEKFKKHNHDTRIFLKAQEVGDRALTADADEAAATALGASIALEYAEIFERKMDKYVRKELLGLIIDEVKEELSTLQAQAREFAAGVELPVIGNESAIQEGCQYDAGKDLAQALEKNLVIDLTQLISYSALKLEALLEPVVTNVFTMYGDYKASIRGGKLTEETITMLSMDLQERINMDRRPVANYIIKEVLSAFAHTLFDVAILAMEEVILERKELLATYKATREKLLDKRAKEELECASIIEELNQNLNTIVSLQAKIDA